MTMTPPELDADLLDLVRTADPLAGAAATAEAEEMLREILATPRVAARPGRRR